MAGRPRLEAAGSSRRPRVERVEALGEHGVTLKILGTVRAPEQWAAAGEFRKRLLAAFDGERDRDPAAAARDPSARTAARDRAARPPDGAPGADRRIGGPARRVRVEVAGPWQRRRSVDLAAEPSTASRDREPPRRGPDVPAGSRRSPPRPTRRPTSTPRPSATSRRSGPGSRASGSSWYEPFDTTLEWDLPFAKWFVGGKLNVSLQLRRPARRERPRRQGRVPLDRRARRHPDDHLRRPPARGPEGGQRAARSSGSRRATASRSTCR